MTITDTQKASPSDTRSKIPAVAFGRHNTAIGLLSIWFAASLAANFAGLFRTAPGEVPLALILSVSAPPLLFLAAYNGVTSVRRYADSLDLRLLTALQGGRVIGFVFLALYAHGLLPGLFAWPAGLGDVLVGAAAPFVLLAQVQQNAGWEKRVWWLNFSGSVDFVVAVATGLLTSQSAIGLMVGPISSAAIDNIPVSLIPTFGVPFFIILHTISFIQLKRLRLQRQA
ncbi:MAG: hypothetical protein O2912_06415 [Proteobacteria bacterium]|nr:hypothetical protein [Pseudomonadota bacterium]